MGTLYVVATPIGNLGDITERALATLRSVDLIAAEDTRRTRQLLTHFGIERPLISYHAFNERSRRERLLEALAVGDVAIVTDAGTPAIADPAADIVRAAHEAGFKVSPIPGASSLVAAASVCGLIDGPFVMLGFLPRSGEERKSMLARGFSTRLPLLLFESPNRTGETLAELLRVLGDRQASVMRELTKMYEEVVVGPLSELAAKYAETAPRGEIVIAVAGGDAHESTENPEEVLRGLLATGMKASVAAKEAAVLTGLPRSELYVLVQQMKSRDSSS
ncbi:16S rRNA (cytidine(1402)-2'-O)-methyltransferase [soil metagenome]